MRKLVLLFSVLALSLPCFAETGPYKVLSATKVGGEGGFDYISADSTSRRLYVARGGLLGRVTVFDLDTLKPTGEIPNTSAHGVAIDQRTQHGFASSRPVLMFDSKTLAAIKTIEVQGEPDGMLGDPAMGRIYILSHSAPNVTVLEAKDGSIVGTIDVGGAPEQSVVDGKGHMYIDLVDKGSIAVVDTKSLKLTATYDLQGKGAQCTGLAIDQKHDLLFAACRNPKTMVVLQAENGRILDTLPIGGMTDGAVFNPNTREVFSSQGDGTLTIVKENSPTSFAVEQTVTTVPWAKTLALDEKTGRIVLPAAEFEPAPPVPPGGRPVHGQMMPGTFEILVVGKSAM